MTLPEGVQPSGPTPVEAPVAPVVEPTSEATVESTSSEGTVTAEAPEDASAEDASDAELRMWARDNGIEDVPGSGKLSATWRETITTAMTAALDPKDEASAEDTSLASSTSSETTMDGEEASPSTEPEPVAEYRSVFQAPATWVSSQTFTA